MSQETANRPTGSNTPVPAQATTDRGAPAAVTPDAVLQLGLGFWGSKTLLTAVELGSSPPWPPARKPPRSSPSAWRCSAAAPRTSSTRSWP